MLPKNCPQNLKKSRIRRVAGVNLIGKDILTKFIDLTKKKTSHISSITDAFVNYKHPTPTVVKIRRSMVVLSGVFLVISLSYFTFRWLQKVSAAAQNYTWNFTTSGDYTVSDSSLIEVAGGTARLKVRNYTSDANTAVLYHFDENTGTSIIDSSTNSNNGIIVSGSWTSGQLNYAQEFNGTQTSITAPDSVSLSVQNSITLEGWTQFLTGFSANSHTLRQPVINKGSYQLFYNNETGKIQFELAPTDTPSWTQVAGGIDINSGSEALIGTTGNGTWDFNGKYAVTSSVQMGGNIYVGLGNNTYSNGTAGPADAEVWKYTTATDTWSLIGGDGIGWLNELYDDVYSLATDGTNLYAGLGSSAGEADLYKYNGTTWSKIGGDGTGTGGGLQSWGNSNAYEAVTSLVVGGTGSQTSIIVGLGVSQSDAEVWYCDLDDSCSTTTGWYKIGGDSVVAGSTGPTSWTQNTYELVSSMAMNNNQLIVGLGNSAGDAEAWTCSDFRTCTTTTGWKKIGGDASGSGGQSWPNTHDVVHALLMNAGVLYAGLGASAGEGEVWSCSNPSTCNATTGWTKIGDDFVSGTNQYESVWSLATDGTRLFVGTGSGISNTASTNDSEVFVCNISSCTFTRAGGDGVATITNNLPLNTSSNTRTLLVYNNYLYAGMQNTSLNTSAEMWRCPADNCVTTSWQRIGGNFIRKSWGYYNMQSVESIATVNGKLYAGTGWTTNGNGVYGNATMWQYDDTATYPQWSMIGGQSVNSSWDFLSLPVSSAPYEGVFSLAGYNGKLYAGLGSSGRDAEVWAWEKQTANTWQKVGGDTLNTSWDSGAEQHETVRAMATHYCSGSTTNLCLFAGLGDSNNDAEVWEYNGTAWVIRGGDATGNWETADGTNGAHNSINSMAVYRDKLYAGVSGAAAGEAELWRWNGTGSSWTMIAGNSSATLTIGGAWDPVGVVEHESVEAIAEFRGDLYVGLGSGVGDAEVWRWTNQSVWTKVGGDGIGWDDAIYESVRSLKVYNGDLYAGLDGPTNTGGAEVWKYDGINWSKVGGDDVRSSWTDATAALSRERVSGMTVYRGKLYAALGETGNNDANIWSYGNNRILNSTVTSQNTSWHHIAASYDGDIMRIFIDGTLDNSLDINSMTIADSDSPLLIGADGGTKDTNMGGDYFKGKIDEIRISNTARSISSLIYKPYTEDAQTVRPQTAQFTTGVGRYASFSHNPSVVGTVTYRVSNNGGTSWQFWDGAWSTSDDITETSSVSQLNTNLSSLPILVNAATGISYGLLWQAVLDGDGNQLVTVDDVVVGASADDSTICADDFDPDEPAGCQNPDPATDFDALYEDGGVAVDSGTWSNSLVPFFSWSGASDDTDGDSDSDPNESGVSGYWVYWGDEALDPGCTNDPQTSGTFQIGTTYSPTLSNSNSGHSYCLRIRTSDKAGNLSSIFPVLGSDSYYIYRLDSVAPTDPELRVSDDNVSQESQMMYFEWNFLGGTQGSDCGMSETCSGINFYEYKSGTTDPSSDYFNWRSLGSTISSHSSPAGDIAYKEGANYFYLHTIDNSGNTSAGTSVLFAYNGETPEMVGNLTASPVSTPEAPSTDNEFTFTWDVPANYAAKADSLEYIYTINVPIPSKDGLNDCIASGDCRVTSLTTVEGVLATRQVPLSNTFYVLAQDTGNGNYEVLNTATADFYVQTPAPGIPRNIDIADVSVKSEESWKLALSWEVPTEGDVATYEIYRSTTSGSGFTEIGSTNGGIAYFDVGLEQRTYYYKVRACDAASSCGEFTSEVSMYPTGKFTTAAGLSADPEVISITTKRATIQWSTDRNSDSKVAYGKGSDDYFDSEPSNSDQVTAHEIALTDLAPGTKYYFTAKWTDEDGNTGTSDEVSFSTLPAPTIEDPKVKTLGIDRITLEYTVEGADKVRIYYGETSTFGGTVELSTSTESQTYTTQIDNLKDGTKYYYKINTFDSEGDEYDGSILTFETLPRPKIQNVKIQQVKGTAQPTVLVVWETNTEVSSIVTYYPQGNLAMAKDIVNIALEKGRHRILVEGLLPQTPYSLIVSGRDRAGNEAKSEVQNFTTATDTRPPLISNMKVEGTIINTGSGGEAEKMAQLLISWDTDESATSQVEFGEGSGTVYTQKTQEDASLTFNHVVVISNLVPSRVYHLRALSKDKGGNDGYSIDNVTITPKATDSALNLVIQNLSEAFGFLNGIK